MNYDSPLKMFPGIGTISSIFIFLSCVQAQTFQWTTADWTTTDWNNASNWDSVDSFPSSAGAAANLSGFTFSGTATIRFTGDQFGVLTGTLNADVVNSDQILRLGGGNLIAELTFEALPDQTAAINKTGVGTLSFFRGLKFDSETTVTANGGLVQFSGPNVTFAGAGNISFEGNGGVSLIASDVSENFGTGYSGSLSVGNNGTLVVNANLYEHTTETTSITVDNSGTLKGAGTIFRATTILAGGILSPGDSVGVLTFDADLNFNTGSRLDFQLLTDTTNGRGIDFSGVDMASGSLEIESGSYIDLRFDQGDVDFSASFWQENQRWLLFDNVVDPNLTSNIFSIGLISNDSLEQSFSITGGSFDLMYEHGSIMLLYTIPEPRAIGLLLGTGTLLFCCFLRRRKSI